MKPERVERPFVLRPSSFAFIALGSNLGDSAATLRRAMVRLADFSDQPLLNSSLWQTTPVDCPPGSPLFVNAVVGLVPRAEESPESLLTKLHALEREFGRQHRTVLNEPRSLDLDLIAFGHEARHTSQIILPHPRAHLRRFVLHPLAEITPDLALPGLNNKTVAELLESLPADDNLRRLE